MLEPVTPSVSVIIPSHNYARFLPAAIESVLGQTRPPLEVIVVDDRSTDETASVAARFGKSVRYRRVDFGRANPTRNAGIQLARGDFVALLDADDLWLHRKLELQMSRAAARPEAGLIYGRAAAFDSESGAQLGVLPRGRCPEGRVLRELYQAQFVPSPTPLIRRDVFHAVGLFDEAAVGSDDWEMWLRIASRFEFAFVDEVVARYRVHASAGTERAYAKVRTDQLYLVASVAVQYPELGPYYRRTVWQINLTFGWQMWRRGDNRSARESFAAALRAAPTVGSALGWFATWLPSQGRSQAIDRAYGFYFNGKYSLVAGQRRRAIGEFTRAIRNAPIGDRNFYLGLAAAIAPARLTRGRLGVDAFDTSGVRPSGQISLRQW